MRVYLETLGCRLNYAEMFALGRQLAEAGHALAASAEGADICILNTCAVTGEAARKSQRLLRQMTRANPAARVLVTGCYATLEGERVAALPNVALVVGNARKHMLLSLIHDLDDPAVAREAPGASPIPAPLLAESRTRAFVKVQDGCRNRCTFCVVTVARGEERSRSVAEVVAEARQLGAEGYQEIVLTGVHLGGYGHELGTSLAILVEALLTETTIPRIRLSSLEPFDLAPTFFDLWADSERRLMPHLHLPAQSGSDAVLRRMARRNTVAGFEALVEAARERIPGLTVTTDLIVGFPGETDADFAATLALVERMQFAHVHVFAYSARAGTAAARMTGHVSEAERHRRSRLLGELEAKVGAGVRAGFLGQKRPVLWEHREDHDQPESNLVLWSGLTDNYLRVLAACPTGQEMRNRIWPARLARGQGMDVIGEIVPERYPTGAPT
jgi:threonylcarbamoyladenosine tRNA methylthiotransferase MtaB